MRNECLKLIGGAENYTPPQSEKGCKIVEVIADEAVETEISYEDMKTIHDRVNYICDKVYNCKLS